MATNSEQAATSSGARSGALVAAASAASIVANYVFLLAAGRVLGSESYGSLAALLGVLAVVLIPAAALQFAVSREVSRRIASGDLDGANSFVRAMLRVALLGTVPLVAVGILVAAPLAHLLHIDSLGVVLLAESSFATALVYPVALGTLQGLQRFHAVAVMSVAPFVLRLGVFAIVVALGYRLGGAVFATVASSIAGMLLTLALARGAMRSGAEAPRPDLRDFLRYLGPVGVGLIGIALLTHVDVLVVKARFSADEAGAYAAASAFARVGFFLPATILTVLFPRTAARQARGEETEDILGRSLLATAIFCTGLSLFYAAAGVGLIATTFGPDFAEGGEVLGPFTLAIGLFSLANILVGYHLSRGETRYAWIVAGGVIVQMAVLALVPSSLRGVVWTNVFIGAALLAAHEVLVGSSVGAIRAALRRVGRATASLRVVAPEAVLVLLGTTAFICALFWPLVVHLGSTVLGTPGSDATATIAAMWQTRHESGYHLLGLTHHSMTGAPFGWDETNALNLQTFLTYYPTYLAAHMVGEVAAYNLVILGGFVLSGATMYLVVRYLGCARIVAAWAALAYIVFPWHLARVEHASLLQIEVLVLLFFSLMAAAKRPSWQRLGLVGVVNLACWLTSGYFGPMAAISTVAFALAAALLSNRRHGVRLVLGLSVAAFAATVLVGIAAVASGTNAGAGLERAVGDLSIYGLRPTELVVPPERNLVVGDHLKSYWITRTHRSNPTEIANYLGLLTFGLALVWLVVAIRRWAHLRHQVRLATVGLAAVFVTGLFFAASSPVILFGQKLWTGSRILWEVVPAFRVASRWDALLMAALVPLAALGLQAIWHKLVGARKRLAVAVVGAAIVFSFLELAINPVEARFRTVPVPPEYAAVERTPFGILAEYPLGYSDVFRLWQMRHGRPLLNGAPPDTPADYARLALLDPAAPGTAEALSLLGVTAIGIHPRAHVDAEVSPREPVGVNGYRPAGRYPDGASVWEVVAAPAPALVTLAGGFLAPRRVNANFVGHALVSTAGVGVLDVFAKSHGVVRLVFDAIPPKGQQRTLRVTGVEGEASIPLAGSTTITVLIEIPRGQSRLLLKTDPAPMSEADAIVVSTPRAVRASGAATVRAEPISPDPGF